MKAFDADVLSELFRGTPKYAERADAIPSDQQAIPIVVVEEMMRGRLNVIRRAESSHGRVTIERAYELFQQTVASIQHFEVLPYTSGAQQLFLDWRQQKIRVATHDLRIDAICVAHQATLLSRNRHDFELVPGLSVEFWEQREAREMITQCT